MAQVDKRGETPADALADEATQLKKRARRRLIGAAALALLAAIVLPMVMDHQPAPPLKDIQVRIPSPDEGVTQRVSPLPARPAVTAAVRKEEKPASPPDSPASAADPAPAKPIAKAEKKAEPQLESRSESKTEAKTEAKPEQKTEAKPGAAAQEAARAQEALAGKMAGESWEVQLGAYQNPASVTNLVARLKQLGIPTYTEKIDTPNGPRTRVRAGPFPSQEAAEKARQRVKIVGVDGPVARKP